MPRFQNVWPNLIMFCTGHPESSELPAPNLIVKQVIFLVKKCARSYPGLCFVTRFTGRHAECDPF